MLLFSLAKSCSNMCISLAVLWPWVCFSVFELSLFSACIIITNLSLITLCSYFQVFHRSIILEFVSINQIKMFILTYKQNKTPFKIMFLFFFYFRCFVFFNTREEVKVAKKIYYQYKYKCLINAHWHMWLNQNHCKNEELLLNSFFTKRGLHRRKQKKYTIPSNRIWNFLDIQSKEALSL